MLSAVITSRHPVTLIMLPYWICRCRTAAAPCVLQLSDCMSALSPQSLEAAVTDHGRSVSDCMSALSPQSLEAAVTDHGRSVSDCMSALSPQSLEAAVTDHGRSVSDCMSALSPQSLEAAVTDHGRSVSDCMSALSPQSLEAAVTDHGRSYSDRVATLLSAWEKLAAMTARAGRDALLSLAQHIYRSVSETVLLIRRWVTMDESFPPVSCHL